MPVTWASRLLARAATNRRPACCKLTRKLKTIIRPKRRFERVQALATQLWQGLKTVAPDGIHNQESGPSAGLVFLHCERAVDMVTALEIENIMVRTIPGENVIRMSTHYLNREQDIDRLIESVGSIWKKH